MYVTAAGNPASILHCSSNQHRVPTNRTCWALFIQFSSVKAGPICSAREEAEELKEYVEHGL
jgi:hypothetical protein